ncbi:apoptotic protease-activating factor 1 isoform X2 [Anoplophora glabripennis]|uniref:apoptotic protease-activating factor 1 isoform X2 n=1 Tax=Anoplophora glabripennis TaxID=217634 RepID=UPI000873AEC4|nr:apoptotic protease-activating factor 1 isoform X2 [Anoplophora glabripennis]
MESESTISKLNSYKQLVDENDLNDFLDYLISQKIIKEADYFRIYNCNSPENKLHEIYTIIDSNDTNTLQKVFTYLDILYPKNKKLREDEENFRISSVRGGFPKLPPNYVTRRSLVEDLKSKLLGLQWDKKVVVHGMMGYGKSCLVNEVLNDPTVRKRFDNLLFWINLGEHHSVETILKPLWRLYATASGIVDNRIFHCPDDVQNLRNLLKTLFFDSRLKGALLILDDACSDEVLSYFNIGCKTVITTQNKKILQREECLFVEVKTGFSRTESLELFKKSIKTNNDLPTTAEEVHEICKGHPMLIALIGSYLGENVELVLNNGSGIWQFIKVMVLRGEYNLNEYDTYTEIPTEKIKKCVEKLLLNGLKDFYQDFAIFMPDVNIPPEVLEILWNKNRFEVINIMNKFAEKSLVVPFYHNDLRTYIYGIHDIYLNYLKDVTKERTVSLHKKLISGYDKVTQGNYAALPNDNYTLQFIGYHLYHAEAFQKFDIYFNLKFLEAKIKAVGKEDVLKDMIKYEICITKNENMLKEKLKHYKDFISRCGSSLYSYEKTDIIQFALREKKESYIFKEALTLAENSPNLYFQLQPADDLEYSTINIKDDITCACYVDSPQHILIGTSSGKIKLFFEDYDKEISSFIGHEGYIKKIIISPDKRYFLSVSIDGTVIVWKFALDSARNSHDFSNQASASPKTQQKLWQDVFTPDRGKVKPTKVFKINEPDNFLVSATFCEQFPEIYRIATGSHRGSVIIWDAHTGEELCKTGYQGYSISCIIYQESDIARRIIFSYEDSIATFKINHSLEYIQTLHNCDVCESIFAIDNKIIAVSDTNITFWERNKSQKLFEKVDVNKQHLCSTLTDDSNYLIVGTNRNTVFILDIEENKMVREFKSKGLAKSLDTFYDEDRSVHILLIGSDQKSLQQCHILPSENEPHIVTAPKFIPFWKKKHPLTALVSKYNQIQVFNGYIQFSETDKIESTVTCTCFSSCGQFVIYGLENGEVHIFNMRSKKTLRLEIDKNNRGPITYLDCYKPNNLRHQSISSYESGDSLNLNFSFEGIIISVSRNELITVYNSGTVFTQKVKNPLIFYYEDNMIVVDARCKIYLWNLNTTSFTPLENPAIFELVTVSKATFCPEKFILAVVYKQMDWNFLDIYEFTEVEKSVLLLKRLDFADEVKSCCFSCDGSLLALGMSSGDIKIWNLNQKFKSLTLPLHNCPVEDLLFSPSIQPPVLVSLGEYIAWWNLKLFQEEPFRKGRPKSIDILDNISEDLSSMNISHWADRECVKGSKYLLSCLKLNGCAKYLSASKDFNTFLTVDDKGKIYVMETVSSNK